LYIQAEGERERSGKEREERVAELEGRIVDGFLVFLPLLILV
jgi:hypothetical protein